ncbi:MAG: hemerythrin domain-containing protein [Planctomycetota bacterium]
MVATATDHSNAIGTLAPVDSPTGRTTVNAAFLQVIKDDNLRLKDLLDSTRALMGHTEIIRNHFSELCVLMDDLSDQLAMHFSLEEAFGYFEDAIDASPHLSVAAINLRNEHCGLFVMARDLADTMAELDPQNEEHMRRIGDAFQQFDGDLKRHEAEELKLILSAMDDDLGVGD